MTRLRAIADFKDEMDLTEKLDPQFMIRELDRTKSSVFMGNTAAFLGSLMCSLNFRWDESISSAATDGVELIWNPYFFLWLKPPARKTVLVHELWHPGRLHFVRMGHRDPLIWNFATDIRINNDLEAEGYSFEGIEDCWKNGAASLEGTIYPPGMPEEDIYDDLIAKGFKPNTNAWGSKAPCQNGKGGSSPVPSVPGPVGDMVPSQDKNALIKNVQIVVKAMHQVRLSKEAGSIPGDIEMFLKIFLTPIVPWEGLFHEFMTDLVYGGWTWNRPNKRYLASNNLYLPSRFMEEDALDHLHYYEDVSGSITDADCLRFNSEVKYVKDYFKPKKLSLIQFDTRITQEITYEEDDPFEEIKIVGRGGTSLREVREHMIKHRPTAAIIFSDLQCKPMKPLPFDIPTIWVCISNHKATVPFGKLIHIR